MTQFAIKPKIDLNHVAAPGRLGAIWCLEKHGPCKLRQGTLAQSQSSWSPEGGDQKHGPDTIDLPTDAITHKHLFLKLFYIYIFCEYGNEDY